MLEPRSRGRAGGAALRGGSGLRGGSSLRLLGQRGRRFLEGKTVVFGSDGTMRHPLPRGQEVGRGRAGVEGCLRGGSVRVGGAGGLGGLPRAAAGVDAWLRNGVLGEEKGGYLSTGGLFSSYVPAWAPRWGWAANFADGRCPSAPTADTYLGWFPGFSCFVMGGLGSSEAEEPRARLEPAVGLRSAELEGGGFTLAVNFSVCAVCLAVEGLSAPTPPAAAVSNMGKT